MIWGDVNFLGYQKYGNFRILFLVGKLFLKKIQKVVEKEVVKYGDILQGRFFEVFNNFF